MIDRVIDIHVYELYGISDEDLCTRPEQIGAQVRLFRVCPFWESRKVTVRASCQDVFQDALRKAIEGRQDRRAGAAPGDASEFESLLDRRTRIAQNIP